MYNRVLNRPMFKRGGDVMDAQGTGITSGLDTPRQRYQFGEEVEKLSETIQVTPEQRRSNALDAITSGFLHPKARTMGEALYYTNAARRGGIEPLEAAVAERKFELDKMPLEKTMAEDVARAGIGETATRTRANILNQAILKRKQWESKNPQGDFRTSPEYSDYENQIIIATQGKTTTLGEARATALELMMVDPKFALIYRGSVVLPEGEQKELAKKQVKEALDRTVDYLMSVQAKAHGGRIGYQLGVGPNVMEEQVTDTVQTPGETVQATEQVEEVLPKSDTSSIPGQDPYKLLRARLPQEITDDVVRLIAYNPEAFKDFAGIESQEDVMLFNQKYGVELILPTEQA
jgi:hypothetical protein